MDIDVDVPINTKKETIYARPDDADMRWIFLLAASLQYQCVRQCRMSY